jgi:hypothetical protein
MSQFERSRAVMGRTMTERKVEVSSIWDVKAV